MEQFPASPISQWDYITKMIDESDYVVLIIAGKYGTEDKIEKKGFTEKEFDYSKRIGKPVLPFLIANPEKLVSTKIESTESKQEKLARFREKVENSGCLVKYYENIDDLKYKIVTSVSACIQASPGIGWVRADNLHSEIDKMLRDNTKLGSDERNRLIVNFIPDFKIVTEEDIKALFE